MSDIFSLVFKDDGLVSRFHDFEARPEQFDMLKAVQKALKEERHLLVEAGTGVGKSLAYLLPIIKWATDCDKKAVVSTFTKTLQEQLVRKDLPRLKDMLGLDFKFALCLGGENYLCLRRASRESGFDLFATQEEKDDFSRILRWSRETESGLRSELDFVPGESVWAKTCRDPDVCPGKKCAFGKDCFYNKARLNEYKSHILVTNHHLFFSHIASGGKVLPRFNAVVFDEAHTLEDVATAFLGIEVSNFQIRYFSDSLFNSKSRKGFLATLKEAPRFKLEEAKQALEEFRDASQIFFAEINLKFGGDSKAIRLKDKSFVFNHLREPLKALSLALSDILPHSGDYAQELEIKSYIKKAEAFQIAVAALIEMSLEGMVYWLEIIKRHRGIKYSLFASPLDISSQFRSRVLEEVQPAIFTSATLSCAGSFEFIKENLGIDEADELILGSPFDYRNNALLYLPKGLPDPTYEFQPYQDKVALEIKDIVSLMKGRTFILFTSFKMMDKIYVQLKEQFKELRVIRQGELPRYRLIEIFKKHDDTVLLGTNTFWQGIDMPGRMLECVVIAKLPFSVPDEPIVEAKMELLAARGKNPFSDYQLPRAIIMLRQGFGRLIRTRFDRGMVAILDPRIKSRMYGRRFLAALPPCRQIHDLEEAKRFFVDAGQV